MSWFGTGCDVNPGLHEHLVPDAVTSSLMRPLSYMPPTFVTYSPYAESKEKIAGFYTIDAEHDDEARASAPSGGRGNPSDRVRPFVATGLVRVPAI
ncbi:MAG: hypothetical protein ACR2NT_11345 [Acidimicrobiia bacterium]